MRRHPIFRLVPPLEKCFHETVTWSQQGKHLEGCELNKSFKKTHEQPRNQEHVTWKWLGSMNHWPQKASCPEEKVDTFAFSRCYRRYQDLLEIPGSEVSENCLASFVADNPRIWLRLSIQFWFVGGNHSRALRRHSTRSPFSPGFGELLMAIYEQWPA